MGRGAGITSKGERASICLSLHAIQTQCAKLLWVRKIASAHFQSFLFRPVSIALEDD